MRSFRVAKGRADMIGNGHGVVDELKGRRAFLFLTFYQSKGSPSSPSLDMFM